MRRYPPPLRRSLHFCRIAVLAACLAPAASLAVAPRQTASTQRPRELVVVQDEDRKILPGAYTNSYALLIGINKYPNLPPNMQLRYAEKDVSDMQAVLEKSYGFKHENIHVLTGIQATGQAILEQLNYFADNQRIRETDRVFIYFSGHGQTVSTPAGGQTGFLIPSDAKIDLQNRTNPAEYSRTCVSMNDVWTKLDLCPARHILVMADACFSGLLATSKDPRGIDPQYLRQWLERRAVQVMTASEKDKTSDEDPGLGNGVFTHFVLEELRARAAVPGLVFTAEELKSAISREVMENTKGRQLPTLGSRNSSGQFLFITSPRAPMSTAAPAPPTPESRFVSQLPISSEPSGAEIWIDGKNTMTRTPANMLVKVPAEGKTVEVSLRKEGFIAETTSARADVGVAKPVRLVLGYAPVDLLKLISNKDVLAGRWQIRDGVITSLSIGPPTPNPQARIVVPYQPPESYVVRMEVERLKETGNGLNLGFTVAGHDGMLVMDGSGRKVWALEAIDGKGCQANETTKVAARLQVGSRHNVELTVHKGHITATCDRETMVDWTGDPARLSVFPFWQAPSPGAIVLGSQGEFTIHRFTMTPMAQASGAALREPTTAVNSNPLSAAISALLNSVTAAPDNAMPVGIWFGNEIEGLGIKSNLLTGPHTTLTEIAASLTSQSAAATAVSAVPGAFLDLLRDEAKNRIFGVGGKREITPGRMFDDGRKLLELKDIDAVILFGLENRAQSGAETRGGLSAITLDKAVQMAAQAGKQIYIVAGKSPYIPTDKTNSTIGITRRVVMEGSASQADMQAFFEAVRAGAGGKFESRRRP